MAELLQLCEQCNLELGFRWSSSKCMILDDSPQPLQYPLYGTTIQIQASFFYLSILFKPGDYLHKQELVTNYASKALATMNQLFSIGVNPKGFSHLLAACFYSQIVRS